MAEDPSDIRRLENRLGYSFESLALLQEALTHASAGPVHNERLEFLGDAVINLVVVELLYARFPKAREGDLTEYKALLVSRATLGAVGRRLGLAEWIQTGGGMAVRSLPHSVLGNAVEALVGAIYLDAENSLQKCEAVLRRWLQPELDGLKGAFALPKAKSVLQEWAQANRGALPEYEILDQFEHPQTQAFLVRAIIGKQKFAEAWGSSKKEAESWAAWSALQELEDHAG
jgi:ribonuclease-3